MSVKSLLKNISPFNSKEDMHKGLYIVKKVLAFFFVFALSIGISEAVVIAMLYIMGYNPLFGDFPQGQTMELIKYFGYALFIAVTLVYCRLVEKRKVMATDVKKAEIGYLCGGLLAVFLLAVIFAVCCLTGAVEFSGIGSDFNVVYLILFFFGFMFQSMAEEVMTRGFLLSSLMKKTSVPVAIFVSSTAFALPHFPTLFEAEFEFALIGVVNLYLVSAVFSMLYIMRKNIYVVGGLHCVWNFVLYSVMGLSLSGSDSNTNSVLNFSVASQNILNGGVYGIEASIVTTVVLGITLAVLVKRFLKMGDKNGL